MVQGPSKSGNGNHPRPNEGGYRSIESDPREMRGARRGKASRRERRRDEELQEVGYKERRKSLIKKKVKERECQLYWLKSCKPGGRESAYWS